MDKRLVTKDGKTFEEPTEEAKKTIAFGIIWSNTPCSDDEVISIFKWNITSSVNRDHSLRDSQGEVRTIAWGTYHQAVEFPNWPAYDKAQTEAALKKAQEGITVLEKQINQGLDEQQDLFERLKKCREVLYTIYDINATGGPGSRAKVSKLLLEFGINSCEKCGKANCTCES
ncbi:MAG: hypothetical protein Q7S32_04735 [bacterium]|nr:hypothetical protein [bacterium]